MSNPYPVTGNREQIAHRLAEVIVQRDALLEAAKDVVEEAERDSPHAMYMAIARLNRTIAKAEDSGAARSSGEEQEIG